MRIALALGLLLGLPLLACEDVEDADGGLRDLGIDFNDAGPVDVGPFDLGPFDLGPFDLGVNDDAGVAGDATFDDATFGDATFDDATFGDATFDDATFDDATFDDATFPDADPADLGEPDSGCSDVDNDTVCDFADVCAAGDDRIDTDADLVPDACDVCPLDAPDDPDGDGICTAIDVCPIGDDLLDFDGDLVADACDNCPDTQNPGQEDTRGIAAYSIPFAPISTTTAPSPPVVLTLGDDDFSGTIPIGFPIFFFGELVTDLIVVSNGFISFDPTFDSTGCCVGGGIPFNDAQDGIVAIAWTDLNPPAGGEVRYFTVGTAPNRRFVVEFFQIQLYASTSTLTAQAVLFEGSDHVEIHTTFQPFGRTYTRGLESRTGTIAAYIRDERNRDFELIDDGEGFDTDPTTPDGIGNACDGFDDVQFAGSGSGSGSGSGVVVE